MVKQMKKIYILILLINLVSSISMAEFMVSAQAGSWQEKVPVIISSVPSEVPTTFSASGFGAHYELTFAKRYQYQVGLDYFFGHADLQKIDSVVVPRRKFNSVWLSNSIAWRMAKSFSFGPQILLNQTTLDLLEPALSTSFLIMVNYEIFDNVRFVQTFGTISNSGQLAYTVGLTRAF